MRSGRFGKILVGLISGFALASGVAQYWLNCGTSLPAQTGLAGMLIVALVVWRLLHRPALLGSLANSIDLFVLAAAAVSVPILFGLCHQVVVSSGIDLTTSRSLQIGYYGTVATVALLILVVTVLRLVAAGASGGLTAIGMLHGALFICPWLGPRGCGWTSAVVAVGAFLVALFRWKNEQTSGVVTTNESEPASSQDPKAGGLVVSVPTGVSGLRLVCCLAIGLLWVAGQRLERQIVPDSFIFSTVEFTVLLGGLAFSAKHRSERPRRVLTLGAVTVAAGCWLCVAAIPVWTWLALQENASLSQLWLLWPLRLGLTLPVLAPIAIFLGQVHQLRGEVNCPRSGFEAIGNWVLLILAWIAGSWLLPVIGVWWLMLIGTSVLIGVATFACDWPQAWDELDRLVTLRNWRKWRFAAALVLVGFAISAPAWVRYKPALPARLLFDGNVFAAHRQRIPFEQLASIDDSRSAVVTEAEGGTLTAWKLRGSTYLIRENGIPKGSFASQPQLAPRYLPDVVTTVLPLSVVDGAESVLILGIRGGEPLTTAAAFPVQRVVAVDADRGVVELAQRLISESADPSVLSDSRFETRMCEPALALQTLNAKFDVIISSPNQPSLPSAACGFTAEAMQAAARRLTEHGLLVIRFPHFDLGLRPIRIFAKTLSSAFAHVAAIELVPGELLFVATNSELAFTREGFIERLQRPQVRELLASCGWDWSAVLRLGLQDGAAIAEWSEHRDAVINKAATSTWPFRLPTEVMKWDNKQQQVRAELQKHERFLMAWGGPVAETADVATRLSEWDLSRQIARRNTDEFWAYRKQVKDHMTTSPRSMIRQVGVEETESGLHPDDDRRLRYFRAIGDAAKLPHPAVADFERIRRYETPFDPLITPFLHGELAELAPRGEPRDIPNELRHRLASINFTAAGDRSIRNVADALRFLNEQPDALPDPAARFDQINSLLQTMLLRWQARGAVRPTSSKVALNDIERSLAAVETSFTTCTEIANARHVCPIAWHARQTLLERQLVRKLRSYRTDVLAHYVKTEQTKANLEPAGDD